MKKGLLLAGFFLLIIFSTFLVSAQWYGDLQGAAEQIIQWIQDIFGPFFQVLLGGSFDLYLFEKILFFFVIIAIVFVALKRISIFESHLGALWVVSLAVSLLSTRFLTETQLIKNVLLSYTVLGVALTAAIPLIIFFLFVHSFESGVLRRVLWIFFLVIFFGLWWGRYEELGKLSWIYFITGILALLFFLIDGTIRRILIKEQMRQLGIQRREDFEREIGRQIRQADDDVTRNIITPSQHSYIKRKLQNKLKAIRKH